MQVVDLNRKGPYYAVPIRDDIRGIAKFASFSRWRTKKN